MESKGKQKQVLLVKEDYPLDWQRELTLQNEQRMFKEMGFTVKHLDTVDMAESMSYNPFKYVQSDEDVYSFADFLVQNTKGQLDVPLMLKKFPDTPETLDRDLFVALIALMRDWLPEKDYGFDGLQTLLSVAYDPNEYDSSEYDDEVFKIKLPLDMIFDEIETGKMYVLNPDYYKKNNPSADKFILVDSNMERKDGFCPAEHGGTNPDEDFALGMYKKFRAASIKVRYQVAKSCATRLGVFGIDAVRNLTKNDEMGLTDKEIQKTDAGYAFVCRDLKYSDAFTLLHKILYMQAEQFARKNGYLFSEVKHGYEQ